MPPSDLNALLSAGEMPWIDFDSTLFFARLPRLASSAASSFFDNLPINVFGKLSRNSISAGNSIFEIFNSRCFKISAAVAVMPVFSLMKALGASPR